MIPYIVMVFVIGLPIFFSELFVGQFSGLGPIKAYRYLAPIFQGDYFGSRLFETSDIKIFKLIFRLRVLQFGGYFKRNHLLYGNFSLDYILLV